MKAITINAPLMIRLPIFIAVANLLVLLSQPPAVARDESRFNSANFNAKEFFPIVPWDPLRGWNGQYRDQEKNGIESIAECHFNMAGFVLPKDLGRCRKLGLGAILLTTDTNFTGVEYFREWHKLSDAEIERRVRLMIDAGGSNPAIMGYFITDEPSASEFPALAKAVAAVKRLAPGKLAYINLFPDYATRGVPPDVSQLGTANYTEYLERFVSEVKPQVLSYDNYMVQYSHDLRDRGTAASYFQNLLEVRRVALKHDLPYLNIVAATQIMPQFPPPSPANLSLQAYTTLAAGYRGVTWYQYFARGYQYAAVTLDGDKTPTWIFLREINREVATLAPVLSQLRSTGVFFSTPAIAEGLPLLPGSVVESANCSAPLMIGEFQRNDGRRYVMVVNLSVENSAKFTLKTKSDNASISIVSAVDRALLPFNTHEGLWLTAGQGVLLEFQ